MKAEFGSGALQVCEGANAPARGLRPLVKA